MPTNTQQTVSPNGGATSKSSRFAPLSDSVKRSPDAADVEPTAKRARANRFDGVFTEREAPKSKVVIPQADHPEIDFLGALFGDKDEKKKALEEETHAKLSFKVTMDEEPHIVVEGDAEAVAVARRKLNAIVTALLPTARQQGSEEWQHTLHQQLVTGASKRKTGIGFDDPTPPPMRAPSSSALQAGVGPSWGGGGGGGVACTVQPMQAPMQPMQQPMLAQMQYPNQYQQVSAPALYGYAPASAVAPQWSGYGQAAPWPHSQPLATHQAMPHQIQPQAVDEAALAASAVPMACPPPGAPGALVLPPGWQMLHDATGRPYFCNHYTQATQWEHPPVPPGER